MEVGCGHLSGRNLHTSCDIPDEAGQLSRDGDTAFVLRHLTSRIELLEAICQARLRFPGNVADDFRLPALTHLDRATDARIEAVRPRRLDQNAPGLLVAGSGDRSLM